MYVLGNLSVRLFDKTLVTKSVLNKALLENTNVVYMFVLFSNYVPFTLQLTELCAGKSRANIERSYQSLL